MSFRSSKRRQAFRRPTLRRSRSGASPALTLVRAPLLPALLLAAACGIHVDDFAIWPDELRIRGAVLVVGEDVQEEAVHRRFFELAGGEDARIVVVGAGAEADEQGLDAAMAAWRDGGASVSFAAADGAGGAPTTQAAARQAQAAADGQGPVDASLAAPFTDATGVWMAGVAPGAGLADGSAADPLARALWGVVERGGAVVVSAGSAEHGARTMEARAAGGGGGGLLPGAFLHADFRADDRDGLLALLEANPRHFGIGLPGDAALELNGRRLRALAGEVVLLVPAGMGRPLREERLRAGAPGRGNQADLTAWRREAIERTLPEFPPSSPAPPRVSHGTLVIVGGGGIPAEIHEAFIEAAGGPEARLIFVPAEERDEVPNEPGIVRSWREAGVASATWIHTKDRRRADGDEAFLEPLRDATGIWFGGGRQWNFADSYYGTTTHRLMHEVLVRGGAIGGTSAGASIQAEYMARGDPLGNQNIIAPGYERGLGFLPGAAVDQHFTERNRQPDMEELMATHPQLLGIGIDEGTALVVRGSVAEVIGRGQVYFYDRRTDPEAEPVVLRAGGAYDLVERQVLSAAEQPAR